MMEPLGSCGRCPDCRRMGVLENSDPPPSPDQTWAVQDRDLTQLESFVSEARGVNGLAVLTYGRDEGALNGLLPAWSDSVCVMWLA